MLLGLSNAIAEVERAWGVAQTNYNRRLAARQQLAAVQTAFETDKADLDMVLEAQRRMSEADTRYFATLAEYALAIKNVHFEKGSLLDHNEVYLAEGPWPGKAYDDAAKRAGADQTGLAAELHIQEGTGHQCRTAAAADDSATAASEVIPLPSPDATPPPEPLPPGQISEGQTNGEQRMAAKNESPASVTVSDAHGDRTGAGRRQGPNGPLPSPQVLRSAMRSAIWPPRWQ